jgi:hypothetical protein
MTSLQHQAFEYVQANPHMRKPVEDAWHMIAQGIIDNAATRKPAPKVYEVHHELAHARECFYRELLARVATHERV